MDAPWPRVDAERGPGGTSEKRQAMKQTTVLYQRACALLCAHPAGPGAARGFTTTALEIGTETP